MLRTIHSLTGYTLGARDGEIGSVEDFYFDDGAWTVRYLVADTGKWLPGRKVLISPISLGKVNWDEKKVEVRLTKAQVQNSPDIDTHKPISRQHETEFYEYYGYPYYWPGPYLWGPMAYPGGLGDAAQTGTEAEEIRAAMKSEESDDQHLRSAKEVTGYYIEASDGDIGHVEDFLIEDESWAIRYMVVDTKNWWPGKKVLVSPEWIQSVSWKDSRVYVDLSRDTIKNAPEYDESTAVPRDYETNLHKHYGRTKYWDRSNP